MPAATQTAVLLITRTAAGTVQSVSYTGDNAKRAAARAAANQAENDEDRAWDLKKASRGWTGTVTPALTFEVKVITNAATVAAIEELEAEIAFHSQDEGDDSSSASAALCALLTSLV